jgi:hypothetical protein
MSDEEEQTFFDELFAAAPPEYKYYTDKINEAKKWKTAYNLANKLEKDNPEKTFLFSAQHKDCIILATILTALNNSKTIIWRPDIVADTTIDKDTSSRERDKNAVNMSASLSLSDWSWNESMNSFLILNGSSMTNNSACKTLLSEILANQKDLNEIISSYYESLEPRYLCVFEFNDLQLKQYLLLSKQFGGKVDIYDDDIKRKIQEIKEEYVENYANANSDDLQSRILVTTSNSSDPYKTHILEPTTSSAYSDMKKNIIDVINKRKQGKSSLIGRIAEALIPRSNTKVIPASGGKQSKKTRRNKKRKRRTYRKK